MKIAYLILCHNDPQHIDRLCRRLTHRTNNDVYIHVDKKVSIEPFYRLIGNKPSIYFVDDCDRVNVFWGGYSSIEATIRLLKLANSKKKYERYILLQGADYPLVSNKDINKFFNSNKNIEFIRACNLSKSNDKYFYSRWRCFWFYDNINIIKKIINKLNRIFNIRLRKELSLDNKKYDIFWGSAQWALTNECIQYILKFYDENQLFNKYFKNVFAPDETYFHTIIFNSRFRHKTMNGGEESEKKNLVNWRNLHYFEYDNSIRVYTENDYKFLKSRNEIFIRKVNSQDSMELLDLLDKAE